MKYFIKVFGVVLCIALNPAVAQDFINLGDAQIGYYTGANVKYYNEYRPRQFERFTSFPVNRCDPVPIDRIGALKVFFTSAIEGHQPVPGQGIVIPTSESVTEVLAVRGKPESSGIRVEAYIGYKPGVYKLNGRNRNRIHEAILLAVQIKNTRHIEDRTVQLFSGALYLTNTLIGLEIKKFLLEPKDWDWNSAHFQQHIREILPKREGFSIAHQTIYLNTPYWTQEENRLKGTTYERKDQ